MKIATAGLVIATVFSPSATALLVTQPNSPCDQDCGNVLSATTGDDMVCNENGFGSSAGIVFQSCINCELGSTYSNNGQTDLQWLLYNLRFALSWCLFGFDNNTAAGSNPCITSTACGPLKEAFEYGNLSTSVGEYDYCDAWIELQVPKCSECLLPGSYHYLNNYVVMLDAGCQQKPAVGSTISVEGSPFSTVPMNVTTPTPSDLGEFTQQKGPISLGGKVGIAIGGLVLILFVLGFGIVCNGRRRRRSFLRQLEMRHRDQGWPHPGTGEGVMRPPNRPDLNDTPLSQKPLRGWDDSPMSATTNSTFPKYFSPYSSQYNSPVSAVDGPNMQWPQNFPSSAQEKALQEQQEAEQSQHSIPIEIGVALGGSEPSIRTQPSNPSFARRDHQYDEEAYEMHEVESAGGSNHSGHSGHSGHMPSEPQAPVLHHPGFVRQHNIHSFKSRTYGGLTEEDARRGNAL